MTVPASWTQQRPIGRLLDAVRKDETFSLKLPLLVARAPGRLDVMGGIADYSGSLVCEMPLSVAAAVAVQKRTDGKLVCRSLQIGRSVTIELSQSNVTDPQALRSVISKDHHWSLYAIGCVWWLTQNRAKALQGLNGLTILVDSDVPLGGGVSSSAAIEVATMSALNDLLGAGLSPMQIAAACQVVENRVVGAPCGAMDQVTSALGVHSALLEILCQPTSDGMPAQVLGQLTVPSGIAFIGVHSGVRHEVSGDPYTDTRVAAFMGQRILSQIESSDLTHGFLARVDPQKYLSHWRAKLPEQITGKDFLEKYQHTNDPVTRVVPEKTYLVARATDHHVLENKRVQRFVELLRDADSVTEAQLIEAGQLMYESHRSYGECAQLGHAMTDLLVDRAKARGPAQGVYGAKITGGGCGGTVAFMIRNHDDTRQLIEQLRKQYSQETSRATTLFERSGPGAAELGTLTLEAGSWV